MKALVVLFGVLTFLFPSQKIQAQGNIDWEELWYIPHPTSTNGPYGWMAGDRNYTGIAYDKWRNVVYVVNPEICQVGNIKYMCPKIRILNASTGQISPTYGREFGTGLPGQLAIPPDTIVAGTPGWPNNSYGGLEKGKFSLYKVDVDDEGRIFAGNLVSPIWYTCYPGPNPPCDSTYINQGPYRVYRWDTPQSAPKRVYATLDANATSVGSLNSSEMIWARWGDAFDVVGQRQMVGSPPTQVDSVRIFVSGGSHVSATGGNPEVNLLLTDTRPNRPGNGLGAEKLDYRLGVHYTSTIPGIAGSSIAVTGPHFMDSIWTDSNSGPVALSRLGAPGSIPATRALSLVDTLSQNMMTGTAKSGAISFFHFSSPQCPNIDFIIAADGLPASTNPNMPNPNTVAHILDVTNPHTPYRVIMLGDTPHMRDSIFALNGPPDNYIVDVDYTVEYESGWIPGYRLIVFVLMSNNGIAAYRSRWPICYNPPIELQSFTAVREQKFIRLSWITASETQNLGFEIERSFNDGRIWERIGFVAGSGTTSMQQRYEFLDPLTGVHRSIGIVRYRLKQIDTDGSTEYSPAVEVYVSRDPQPFVFHPSPNPARGETSITFTVAERGHIIVKLYSIYGEEIATLFAGSVDTGTYVLHPPTTLPSGLYFCIAETALGPVRMRFLIAH